MKTRLALITGLLATLSCAFAPAQEYKTFPGEPLDNRTRMIQERVEDTYLSGNYRRALLIYEQELAPIGDKYAQYMVGFMHLNAQGTAPDRVEALAWYRLSAERGTAQMAQVRDQLIASMSDAEVAASDARFIELWREMSDRVLIVELIQRDMEILREQTGSHIAGARGGNPVQIIRPDGEPVGPTFYQDLQARLEARIEYLDAKVEISDEIIVQELERIREEEAAIKDELAVMQNP
mgnify:FL=1